MLGENINMPATEDWQLVLLAASPLQPGGNSGEPGRLTSQAKGLCRLNSPRLPICGPMVKQ